jgi:hypothetical protein
MCRVIWIVVVAFVIGLAAEVPAQEITRVNVSSNGDEATDASQEAAISSDGRYVVLSSIADKDPFVFAAFPSLDAGNRFATARFETPERERLCKGTEVM